MSEGDFYYKGLWLNVFPMSILFNVLVQWKAYERDHKGPIDGVLDIGAHHGSLACLAAGLGKARKVIAVEPVHVGPLRRNIERNKLDIEVLEAAVGVGETASIRWCDNGGMQSILYRRDEKFREVAICAPMPDKEIPVVHLLDLIDRFETIDYLKCDVEGAEFTFMGGDDVRDALKRKVRYIDLEIHPLVEAWYDAEDPRIRSEYRLGPFEAAQAMMDFIESAGFKPTARKEDDGFRIWHLHGFNSAFSC